VGKSEEIRQLVVAIQDYVLGISSSIEEAPKKQYIAYRTTQNIVCVEVQKQKVCLFLKLDPTIHEGPPGISRDVSALGHFGTGAIEVTLRSLADLEASKPWILKAYEAVGG
jgi:predicted transport protein